MAGNQIAVVAVAPGTGIGQGEGGGLDFLEVLPTFSVRVQDSLRCTLFAAQ